MLLIHMGVDMINQEKEYRKVFLYHKRRAKHWITPSAHRAHSSTISSIKPAEKSLEFINKLNEDSGKCFKEKVDTLIEFYDKENALELSNEIMGSRFYYGACKEIKRQKNEIESGKEATIHKMPRS